MNADEPASKRGIRFSRRGFLGATGAVGSAAAAATVWSAPAEAAPAASEAQRRTMILQLAAVGVIFPLRLPGAGSTGPAKAQKSVSRLRAAQRRFRGRSVPLTEHRPATTASLQAAERAMSADRLALARTGADTLIARNLLDAGQADLLQGAGKLAAGGSSRDRAALTAAVELAVGTVFPGSGKRATTAAGEWVGLLATMYRRGDLPGALRQRGIR